ncbi:hypothetical protein EDB89DRAFT_1914148 [Lactarius sanguifluus]|nr:hypothetical protein EDB89DRAFT_1914148 [Lactarius sanguifluus]
MIVRGLISGTWIGMGGAEARAMDTIIASIAADYLSTHLSLLPSPSGARPFNDPMDFLLTSASHYLPSSLDNPARDPREKRKYVGNQGIPRALASFGSKVIAAQVKGIFHFETGVKVN